MVMMLRCFLNLTNFYFVVYLSLKKYAGVVMACGSYNMLAPSVRIVLRSCEQFFDHTQRVGLVWRRVRMTEIKLIVAVLLGANYYLPVELFF